MSALFQDLKYGLRMLAKNPGVSAVAVLSLALGIGANSTVFSIVDGMFLRPWPVKNPSRLVVVSTNPAKETGFTSSSYPDYLDIRNQVSAFEGVLAYGQRGAFVSGKGQGEMVTVDVVSENYFAVLGVNAALGRTFSTRPDQAEEEGHAVVVSYGLWQRRFGADPGLPGQVILLDGKDFTVLGATPQEFHGLEKGSPTDVWVTPKAWVTMVPGAGVEFEGRDNRWFELVARLQPKARLEQARTQLQTLANRLAQAYPATNKGNGFGVISAAEEARQGLRSGLFLMAMVSLVLLISCANVANLLLAQTERRQREIAMRLALGAGQRRLVAQLLTEGLLLAWAGGVLGLVLAGWLINLLPALPPLSTALLGTDVRLDFRVLLFTAALSLLTALVFGLAPALHSSRFDLVPVLKGEDPRLGRPSSGRFPLRSALVAGETALCLVLLVGSGLLLRSLLFSQRINPGFDRNKNVLMLTMAPPTLYGYNETQSAALYQSLVARLESLPGVVRASYARRPPLTPEERGETQDVTIPGMELSPGRAHLNIRYNIVTPNFFRTVGTRILRGRDFSRLDTPAATNAVIVNETMARQFWPAQEALGRFLRIERKDYQIVGVVESGKYVYLHDAPEPYMFFPFSQMFSFEAMLFVETAGDSEALAHTILREAQSVDKNLPVVEATTLREYMRSALGEERASVSLLAGLSVLGIFLAAVGLYGVVAYLVNRRTHEIGIRMALGARQGDVLRMVLGRGIRLGGLGAAVGLVAAFAVAQVMSGRLYGVKPLDPLTYAAGTAVVVAVALLASYLPARRATKVDPMVALRYE
ncbi:MAG: ABC transporter permease [Terriglobia bacterium]